MHDLVVGVVGLHLVDFCVVVFHFDFGKADLVDQGLQFSMVFGRFAPVSFESLYALEHTAKPHYGLFAVFEGPRHFMHGEPFYEVFVEFLMFDYVPFPCVKEFGYDIIVLVYGAP